MREQIVKRARELAGIVGAPRERIALIERHAGEVWHPPVLTREQASALIDHTLLVFDATAAAVEQLCAEAAEHSFKAVCVNPCWVATAKAARERLGGRFLIASVIDFPLGASTVEARRVEAAAAIADGSQELDLVIGIGLLKSGKLREVYEGIRCVAGRGAYLKVILETSALTPDEKRDAAILAVLAGADMLKTSTGVNGKATVEDVAFLRTVAGSALGVKASGGIRDRAALERMVAAGADRIGASASCAIMGEWR